MSQSFIKRPDNGPHSALSGLGVLASEQPRPPCTVCGKPAAEHGSYPTCAAHPYTPDENCQHVLGARCVGAECRNGCVRARGGKATSATVSIEVLRQHWLRAMECDHATSQDKPHCSCSQIDLGWHPSIGAAVEAWLAHVAGVSVTDGVEEGQRG